MQAHLTRRGIVLLAAMQNIQVNRSRQRGELAPDPWPRLMDDDQINIGAASQERIGVAQGANQVDGNDV
jgi:hypothetical protein